MAKRKIIGMRTGYASNATNPGEQWTWGQKIYTSGHNHNFHSLGGHFGSLNSNFDDNTGESWMYLIYPKAKTGSNSVLYNWKMTSKPKVLPHYETGKNKSFDYTKDRGGWQLQTKSIQNGDDLERNKYNVLWWYSYADRKNLFSWCWTSYNDDSTPYEYLNISGGTNDDEAKNAWWGHLVQSSSTSTYSKTSQKGWGNPRNMSNSRLRNVIGFTCNCMIKGNESSWMHPQTIGLIMNNGGRTNRIVIPTEPFGGTQHLTQNIIGDTYWHNGQQSSIDSSEWKGQIKGKVLELNYICTQDVIAEIVSGKWEFMGVWWKMGSHCSKSSGKHSRQCGIWNFRPIVCGQDGSVGTTWNNNRYNILGNQKKYSDKNSLYFVNT